jgi:hypothetical protein
MRVVVNQVFDLLRQPER